MKIFVDANVLVFAALERGEAGAKAGEALRQIRRGLMQGFTSSLALDEVMWTLIKNRHEDALELVIREIYKIPNFQVLTVSSHVPILALGYLRQYHLRPRDAFHCATMEENGITQLLSDDRDFDRVKEIKRIPL